MPGPRLTCTTPPAMRRGNSGSASHPTMQTSGGSGSPPRHPRNSSPATRRVPRLAVRHRRRFRFCRLLTKPAQLWAARHPRAILIRLRPRRRSGLHHNPRGRIQRMHAMVMQRCPAGRAAARSHRQARPLRVWWGSTSPASAAPAHHIAGFCTTKCAAHRVDTSPISVVCATHICCRVLPS